MCGVSALFAYHSAAPPVDRHELRRVCDAMASRGPDGEGYWYSENGRLGLGHRRLAIIDLSPAGAQPMVCVGGTSVLSFNGEIYNHAELRAGLEARGHRFHSKTDTEVILRLYEEKGADMLNDLRGMFAIALWDDKLERLLLARDPYGIKPLYYADDGWTVRVASQVKALLAGGGVSRHPDAAGIAGFFLTGSVPEPFTVYQQIRAVPAGSLILVDDRGPSAPRSYVSIAATFREAAEGCDTTSPAEQRNRVRDAVEDSVRSHLLADVPVGAFLSGGIDSGAIVGLASSLAKDPLTTITLAFEDYRGSPADESPMAEIVARHYGTRHTTRLLDTEEMRASLPDVLKAMDQPSIDGLNTYFVSSVAREAGLKVVLSGLGGDELFGGYPSFCDIPRWVRGNSLPGRIPGLGRLTRTIASRLAPPGLSPKAAGMIEYAASWEGAYLLRRGLFMPWELKHVMGKELAEEGLRRLRPLAHIRDAMQPEPGTAFGRVAALESSLYMRNQLLRDADWAGMAHSLEIRVPLVDIQLTRQVAPLLTTRPGLPDKSMLAEAPRSPPPESLQHRPKTGFSVPIEQWLERDADLDAWRRIPSLQRSGCPWARRWAYTVATREGLL